MHLRGCDKASALSFYTDSRVEGRSFKARTLLFDLCGSFFLPNPISPRKHPISSLEDQFHLESERHRCSRALAGNQVSVHNHLLVDEIRNFGCGSCRFGGGGRGGEGTMVTFGTSTAAGMP